MAYDQRLAERIRERLSNLPNINEKEMMGGLSFLYNGKMCVGIIKDEMMCRIDPTEHEAAVERHGCRVMDFTKKPMKGWVMIEESGMKSKKDLDQWIELALAYHQKAKKARRKNKDVM